VRDRLSQLLGPNAPPLVQVLADLARLYTAAGDHLAAEPTWRRIAEINRQARSDRHAFEACAEKWIRLMTAICNDRISDYQHHQYSLDRAIHGQF
jgi:hypothetical protein